MITSFLRKCLRLAWLLPGFLLWAAFPPMGERMDCLFALAPLLWLARRGEAKASFRRWYLNGLVFWVATLSWMPAIVKNGGPWPLVVLGWFALAAYCSLFFGLFGLFTARYWGWARRTDGYWKRLVGLLFVEPILWAGIELVRSRLFGGFSWNQLGIVPANSGFGAPAAWGGVYLLSAVVILINGTIASIAERVLAPKFDRFLPQTLPNWARSIETFLPFLLIWGIYSLPVDAVSGPRPNEEESALLATRSGDRVNGKGDASVATRSGDRVNGKQTLTVGLVQRNFPCCFKVSEEDPYRVYERLLATLAPFKPDLVVLPESALAEFGLIGRAGASRFAKFVYDRTGASVLAGGTRVADGTVYNSAALYTPPDPSNMEAFASPQTYDKVHLVPFGEYIPGDKAFPFLQNFAPVGSCTAGVEKFLLLPLNSPTPQPLNSPTPQPLNSPTPQPLNSPTPQLPLGVSICYEDTDSAQVCDFARAGARVLVFITNDSWFSGSIETVQHAWHARVRAIETGLSVARVGNSGVSGVIRPDGSVEALCGADGRPLVDAQGAMLARVDVSPRPQTFYVRFGDKPLAILFLLLKVLLILVEYKEHHEKRRTVPL